MAMNRPQKVDEEPVNFLAALIDFIPPDVDVSRVRQEANWKRAISVFMALQTTIVASRSGLRVCRKRTLRG